MNDMKKNIKQEDLRKAKEEFEKAEKEAGETKKAAQLAYAKELEDEANKMEALTNDIGKDDYVDDEGRMAKSQMYKMGQYIVKLSKMLDDMEQLPAWVQSKITKASSMMSAVYHYLDYEMVRRDGNLMEHLEEYKKEIDEKLDPVGQEDDDIDNDGDVDKTDKYLAKRRKAVSKAIAKQKK